MKKKSLHMIILGFCLLSYGWLFFNWQTQSATTSAVSVCILKNVTGIPCPSCGTTRSVMSVYAGDIKQAVLYNPIGIIAAIILVFFPFWMAYDFTSKKSTLHSAYQKMEYYLKNKLIAIPMIVFVLANWMWNIIKDL